MSESITINAETFAKLTDADSKPVRFIIRQVGDGPITEYHHTRNGDIHVAEDTVLNPGSMAHNALEQARIMATATGSVAGNWIETADGRDDQSFALAAQWVRAGSTSDRPVVVEA